MNNKAWISEAFLHHFNRPIIEFKEVCSLFQTEAEYLEYLKKTLYFTAAVIAPLKNAGMTRGDSIIDIASGDGQMSLSLALLGFKNLTLFDLDEERLKKGARMIDIYCNDAPHLIHDSALNLNRSFDVVISFQTIEHLSDEGNYSIAKKHCQKAFLRRINEHAEKLCYLNAPNKWYPIDGHDTGLFLFHRLPLGLKKYLIRKKMVRCSWRGICQPVSVSFINRHLKDFELRSYYYAFQSMDDYLTNYPACDYMGNKCTKPTVDKLPISKKLVRGCALILGKQMQNLLPNLSVIYHRKKR